MMTPSGAAHERGEPRRSRSGQACSDLRRRSIAGLGRDRLLPNLGSRAVRRDEPRQPEADAASNFQVMRNGPSHPAGDLDHDAKSDLDGGLDVVGQEHMARRGSYDATRRLPRPEVLREEGSLAAWDAEVNDLVLDAKDVEQGRNLDHVRIGVELTEQAGLSWAHGLSSPDRRPSIRSISGQRNMVDEG